jgi:hypothetical protein
MEPSTAVLVANAAAVPLIVRAAGWLKRRLSRH